MNPILFLDVDGVLNSNDWFNSDEGRKRDFEEDWREALIDPNAILNLNRIVEETQCEIVLSSTWRRGNSLGSTLRVFKRKGLSESAWRAFIGTTPSLDRLLSSGLYTGATRGQEIQSWLIENPGRDKGPVAILDDDGDMGELLTHLFLVNANEGLTHEIANRVIDRLKPATVTA